MAWTNIEFEPKSIGIIVSGARIAAIQPALTKNNLTNILKSRQYGYLSTFMSEEKGQLSYATETSRGKNRGIQEPITDAGCSHGKVNLVDH